MDNIEEIETVEESTATEVDGSENKEIVCSNCGKTVAESLLFCPYCGKKVNETDNDTKEAYRDSVVTKKTAGKAKLFIMIAAIAVIAVLAVIFMTGSKGFDKMYADMASESWCTIASDGSYIKIDTNPKDKDSDDLTWTDYESFVLPASEAIEKINKDLGFSDVVMEKMNTTSWSQGKQTESNKKYTVTWTYHPDKGLVAIYEPKK